MKKLEIQKEIVSDTRLTWNEKALISLILRYQNTGITFTLTDKKTASELGLKESSIYGLVSNLAKMNIIAKHTDNKQINAGQKPKNVRYITLKDISEWFVTENKTNTNDISDVQEIDEEPTSTTDTTSNESKVDIDENNYIIASSEDYVSNRSDVAEFLELYPNYHENQPLKVSFDFGDGDNIMDDAYFYKQVDGISKYISLSNIEDYKDGRGLYKKY